MTFPPLGLAITLACALVAADAGAAGPPSFSPLPPLNQPGGPLLAQAGGRPGSSALARDRKDKDDEEEDEDEPKKAPPKPPVKQRGQCESDKECPAQTACFAGFCKSTLRGTSALFYFSQPGPIGHRVVLPFYFSFWRPEALTRVVAPVFVQHKDFEKKTSDVVVPLLLYQYHSEPGVTSHRVYPLFFYSNYGKEGASGGLYPLFWTYHRGPQTAVVLPPVLSFYRQDRSRDLKEMLLLGLVYARKEGSKSTVVVPPLASFYHNGFGLFAVLGWMSKSKDEVSGGLFPLVWHFHRPDHHSTAVFPLFLEAEDKTAGRRHVTLLPFFHYQRDDQHKRRLVVTLLGGQYTDGENAVTVSALLTPPLFHRDEPRRRFTVLPPLALWWRNKETGKSLGYVGPIFWSHDDEGSTAGVLPLYYRFHDQRRDATTHLLLPIGLLHHSPGRVVGVLGPVYGWSRKTGPDAGAGGGVFPLVMVGLGQRSHVLVLPPLFAFARDRQAGTSHVSLGPIFFRQHHAGRTAGWDAGVLPLLYLGRRGDTNYQVLLPLFFHKGSPREQQLMLGPLFLNCVTASRPGDPAAGITGLLFPVLWLKNTTAQSYAVVPPLLWLAHDKLGRRSVGVIGPVFWHREAIGPRGSGQGSAFTGGVFPLAYLRSAPGERTFLSPLVVYHSYRHRDERGHFLWAGPYLDVSRTDAEGQSTTRVVLPLAFFHSSPGRSAQVIFPIFWQAREEGTTVRSVLLLYHGVTRQGLSAHLLFPVFFHESTERGTTTLAGPFFYHRRRDPSALGVAVLPLFGYGHNDKFGLLATPAGFYLHNYKTEHKLSVFGLFYGDFRPSRSDYGVFPLFFGARRGTASAWVGPFIYHSSDPAQERSLTVLTLLYFGHRGQASYGGLVPFVFGRSDGKGGYGATVFPLFYLDHRRLPSPETRLFSLIFGYTRNATGFRAYVGPLYLRSDAEVQSQALFPIFYHSRDRAADSSTLLILPLLFRHRNPEGTLTAVTPLFWQRTSLTGSVVVGFPLILDVHRRFESRLTAIVPFLVRHRNYPENITTWLFPPILTYAQRHGDGRTDVVTFPVFWHFGGADCSTTVLLPIFYHLRRPGYTATVLLPLFGRYRDYNNNTSWIFPPLLTYVRTGEDGSRDAVVFPIFWYGRSPGQSTAVFFPLFWQWRRPQVQATVFAPVGAHWRTAKGAYTLVFNLWVYRGKDALRGSWDFHFWPLMQVGRPRQQDLEWNVLGGLVGYTRIGTTRTLKLLWGISVNL